MRTKFDSQGVALPIVVGAIALIAVIVAVVWTVQNPSSQSSANSNVMMEKNTNDNMVGKTDDVMMENKTDDAVPETNTKDSMMEKTNEGTAMEKDDSDTMMEKEPEVMTKPAPTGYITYSSQAYADAKNQKRVLFFHATWCPTCKATNADFTTNTSKIPSNVVVFKTDYDTEAALKTKYGITYQHTFVQVDAEGNAIAKWNGGDVDELLKNLK